MLTENITLVLVTKTAWSSQVPTNGITTLFANTKVPSFKCEPKNTSFPTRFSQSQYADVVDLPSFGLMIVGIPRFILQATYRELLKAQRPSGSKTK